MRKKIVKILTGLAVTLIVLAVVYFIWVASSTAKLRRAYAALEKDDRPMETSDVTPPEVLDEDNAALLYESATLLLRSESVGDEGLIKRLNDLAGELITGTLDKAGREELERLLQKDIVVQALKMIAMGAEKPACRFDMDYGAGINMLMPHLNHIRSMARILAAKAHVEAQAGRLEAAWDTLRTQLRHAEALRGQPIIISQLVRNAQIEWACQTIQALCEVTAPTEEQCRYLNDRLSAFEDIEPLIHSIDGERLLFGEAIFNLRGDELREQVVHGLLAESHVPDLFLKVKHYWIGFRPLLLADHAAYLSIMHDYTRWMTGTQEEYGTAPDDVEGHRITTKILPAIARVKVLHLRMVAQTRITRGGMALLRYKQEHSTFPKTLEALSQQDLLDPFSGKPLVYWLEGDGFVLYSIADDEKDNGGQPKKKSQIKDFDIVWRYLTAAP